MRRKKRNFWLLIASFLSLASLVYLIFSFPPNFKFSIFNLAEGGQLSTVVVFFSLLFLFLLSLISYLFKSTLQGILISSTIIIYLLLRILGLTQLFFLIIILALLFVVELFLRR